MMPRRHVARLEQIQFYRCNVILYKTYSIEIANLFVKNKTEKANLSMSITPRVSKCHLNHYLLQSQEDDKKYERTHF